MNITTKFFGEMEINENSVVTFENGIPGFEEYNKFTVIDIEDKKTVKCLQCVENRDICFLIITPWEYFKDYEIELSDDELKKLEIEDESQIIVFNVMAARNDKLSVNLVAPIIINIIKNKGKQIILSNTDYDIRQEITCLY